MTISYEDFEKVDIRVGRVIRAEVNAAARKPAYKLWVDFGPEVGELKSSAQLVKHYTPEDLVGRLVMGVVNFPPKQIGPVRSECLVLGVPDAAGEVILLQPERDAPLGGRMF
ncbi:tRNA-binding protein [Oleispirillum naphthae]|uniref:tRNA-binding protein n=1 Tax=Oleispirillum naphthae TaxID=2838853 RepID=UPI0030824C3F